MTSADVTALAVAVIAALGSVLAAWLASRSSARTARVEQDHAELRREYAEVERARDACMRDRRQLRQTLQLVVGAFVGLIPERERLQLLRTVDETLEEQDDAA